MMRLSDKLTANLLRTGGIFMVALIMLACGQGKTKQQTLPADSNQGGTVSSGMADHPGKKVYNSICLACHMADGKGIDGINPPIISSTFVNGDPEPLIELVLKGKSGKTVINGKEYNGIMPPHAHLSDKQIADVLTYVRGSFGNNSGAITLEQVQQVRNKN